MTSDETDFDEFEQRTHLGLAQIFYKAYQTHFFRERKA